MSQRLHTSLAALLSATMALTPGIAPAQTADMQNVRLSQGGGANSTSLVLAMGKSAIIDLPADARDVLLSNPEVADAVVRTPRRVYVIGRTLGQTNAFFFDAEGRQIANLEVRVEPDVASLNDILRRHAANGNIRAEAVNGSLILTGTVRSAAEADRAGQIADRFVSAGGQGARLVNLIQVESSEQVMVRVRVVEMSRTLVRQLGVNINSASNIVGSLVPDDVIVNAATQNGYSIAGRALGGLGVGVDIGDDGGIDGSIDAFERAGLLRVLAEPNLTAISGESARFLAGGEFPIPVNADDGQVSIEFKPFGVGLAFTPVVLSGGRISLKLSTEVSELTAEGAISTGDTPIRNADDSITVIRGVTIPALQVRRAETTVEMPSGGALVLAGLIQERTRQALEGIPGAMNMPVLGSLFRSRDFANSETELVIIVTPYLVTPTSPDRLRTPADGFMNPGEIESLLTGRLNAMYRPSANEQGERRGLQGPHGHVIE